MESCHEDTSERSPYVPEKPKSFFHFMLRKMYPVASRVPCEGLSPTVPGTPITTSEHHMKESSHIEVEEPVGIVISGGSRSETTPRFSAYMWAPAPEDDVIDEVQAA